MPIFGLPAPADTPRDGRPVNGAESVPSAPATGLGHTVAGTPSVALAAPRKGGRRVSSGGAPLQTGGRRAGSVGYSAAPVPATLGAALIRSSVPATGAPGSFGAGSAPAGDAGVASPSSGASGAVLGAEASGGSEGSTGTPSIFAGGEQVGDFAVKMIRNGKNDPVLAAGALAVALTAGLVLAWLLLRSWMAGLRRH